MKLIPYTYIVLRYVHDRGAGEALNVGVLVFSAKADYLDAVVEHRYERLSHTFAGFNGDHYRRSLMRFRTSLEALKNDAPARAMFRDHVKDISAVLPNFWQDRDTSFCWGEPLTGLASDLNEELQILFDRMVTSQHPQGEESAVHNDEYVWKRIYQDRLPQQVVRAMTSKRVQTDKLDMEFPYALKNGQWHIVQPVSLDYKEGDTMQKKATSWVGTSVALQQCNDIRQIFFLLGKPTSGKNMKAYARAKGLLDQSLIPHQIIEEEDIPRLSEQLNALLDHD